MIDGDPADSEREIIFDEMDVFEQRAGFEEQLKFWVKLRLTGRDEYSEDEVKGMISKFIPSNKISSLGKLTPNVFTLRLKDAGVRENLIRTEYIPVDDESTVWILPKHSREVRGTISYLPFQVPNEFLCKALSDLGEFDLLERVGQVGLGVGSIKSDVRYFSFRLNPKKTVKDLPYWFQCGEHRGHIKTASRKPLCNHCKQEGHTKIECEAFKKKLASYSERYPTGIKRISRGKRHRPLEQTDEIKDLGVEPPKPSEGEVGASASRPKGMTTNALETLKFSNSSSSTHTDRIRVILREIIRRKNELLANECIDEKFDLLPSQ